MNPGAAFLYLFETLINLYITAVLVTFLLQWVKADFYNPVCQFLVTITDPLLVPLRRVIPSFRQLDTAAVVLMLALETLSVSIINRLTPVAMSWPEILMFSVVKLLMTLLGTYFILIIAMVILSWVGARLRHPIIPLIFQLTDPVLRPFRRFIPPIGGIDLSPLFALIAIRFLMLLLGW